MVESQGNRCAICGTDRPGGRGVYWHIDHCHETGRVRGLLCYGCNTLLGAAKDNPETLRSALEYINRALVPGMTVNVVETDGAYA